MSLQFLDEFYRYLNTESLTTFGVGLGLEVTTGGFFFGPPQRSATYFDSTSPQSARSGDAKRLGEFLMAGIIDTNHAFGDFDDDRVFERAHAQRAYEELEDLGTSLSVFTNHGNANNIQNVGTDAEYHQGDLLGGRAYHADLLSKNDTRFVWTDSLIIPVSRSKRRPLPGLFQRSPSLTSEIRLQDGTSTEGFLRVRGTGSNAPNLGSMGRQIDLIDWTKLYRRGQAVVLYQHLGVLNRVARRCYPASVDDVLRRVHVYLAPFRFLAKERDEGRLWIAGAARLLRYVDTIQRTRVLGIDDVSLKVEVFGDAPYDLQGLTVYVDPNQPIEYLWHGGQRVEIHHNGPDATGRYSISVPVKPLRDIW